MINNIVHLQDCMVGMKQYPDKYFDLAIVDPPYGIGITGKVGGGGASGGVKNVTIGGGITLPKQYNAFDDSSIPSKEYFIELSRISKRMIIWGGNYFLDHLGKTKCIIVWDKGRRGINFADCEIAWTNINDQSRIFDFRWNGMLQGNMKAKELRIHPTQKPVALYEWLLNHYAKDGDKILDTHVGSGSSRIACYNLGFDFTGYEIDETYWRLQEERFAEHRKQMNLFIDLHEEVE